MFFLSPDNILFSHSAIESNFAPGNYGGWADISASPWLYHLFKVFPIGFVSTDGPVQTRVEFAVSSTFCFEEMESQGEAEMSAQPP